MYLKTIISAIFILYITNCTAQETVEKKGRINYKITEKYNVLKSDENIKDGPYEALIRKKVIANGNYTKGKKTGLWYFYDSSGLTSEVYNYDTDSLKFEAREYNTSDFRYLIDKKISDTDKVTKPLKIGGRYYGYLPYLGAFRTPLTVDDYTSSSFVVVMELLISPLGRLADYKVRVVSSYLQYDQTTHMDVNLFKEEDKQFIPATYNGFPILSRIVIKCRLVDGGGLDFFTM